MTLAVGQRSQKVARLNVMRLGATRLGWYQPWIKVYINGVPATGARVTGATITDELDHEPNTASFNVSGIVPLAGQSVAIYCGDTDLTHELFGGRILAVNKTYEAQKPANVIYACQAIDPTWLLNRRTVIKKYTSQSADAIALDLISSFTSGVTTVHVATGLATIDEITFTNEDVTDALTRLCERIGGYWYIDYASDLHLFLSETTTAAAITTAAPRGMSNIVENRDLSQIATRIIARGGGSNSANDVDAAGTTIPLEDSSWYGASGTVECGPQRITYASVVAGGGGAMVGSGNAPTSAPGVGRGKGTNLAAGSTYQWAVTFVTAAGQTLPGPMQSLTPSAVVTAPGAVTAQDYGAGLGVMVPGGTYHWAVELIVFGGGKIPGTASAAYVVNGNFWKISIDPAWFTNDPKVSSANYYRTTNGGATYYAEGNATLAAPTFLAGGTYWHIVGDALNDASLAAGGTIAGSADTLLGGALYNVPVSSSGSVTSRKIYRTVAGGSQLKLVGTIANNTDTTYLDTTVDGSLGANAPTSDTSGLTTAGGQVNAGLTSLLVTDTAPFSASGGWVRAGSLTLHYTGISGNSLTLAAALPSSLSYGTEVVILPHLAGCTGIMYAILKGDQVNVVVIVNDAAAQTALAALVGGDGIHEHVITDGRWSITEATARANAELTMRKDPLTTVSFDSRDPSMQSGRDVTLTITSPAISGTFKIQRVTITELGLSGPTGFLFPLRHVEVSSRRYSFEDVLRQIRKAAA